jgi:hypothetical protein
MYTLVGIQKLSETQKSRLRNGHPVRIKKGSGNQLHLTNEQIKKLESAAKKGAAYTLTLHPEQAEKHGSGFFGDIASKAKKFAISTIKANRDLINPIIGRVRAGAKSGIQKLADKANAQVDKYTPVIFPIFHFKHVHDFYTVFGAGWFTHLGSRWCQCRRTLLGCRP